MTILLFATNICRLDHLSLHLDGHCIFTDHVELLAIAWFSKAHQKSIDAIVEKLSRWTCWGRDLAVISPQMKPELITVINQRKSFALIKRIFIIQLAMCSDSLQIYDIAVADGSRCIDLVKLDFLCLSFSLFTYEIIYHDHFLWSFSPNVIFVKMNKTVRFIKLITVYKYKNTIFSGNLQNRITFHFIIDKGLFCVTFQNNRNNWLGLFIHLEWDKTVSLTSPVCTCFSH